MVRLTESALRHGLTEAEVAYAWEHAFEHVRVRAEKQPPHYMALGPLPNGRTAEMVGLSVGLDWVVFHAMVPPTPGFMHEYELERGRKRGAR